MIWKPISFDNRWNDVKTEEFDNIFPSWEKRREELKNNNEQYERFMDRLKRKQAIDTGIIERMYDLKRGITETFVAEGFIHTYLQHGDTDIEPNLLMDYLGDNFEAIDFVFDYVKDDRILTIGYIKELHALITRHQQTVNAVDQFGNEQHMVLKKGEFKTAPNNPKRDDRVFYYCPPEQVDSEMDRLVDLYNNELKDVHIIVKTAFLHHAFTQIHPFQDGNGRIARLLASFVLIKNGLFPFSIDREDRIRYIDSLEQADSGHYQQLADVIADNQITSIKHALNWRLVDDNSNYDSIMRLFGTKLGEYRKNEQESRKTRISKNLNEIYIIMCDELSQFERDIKEQLDLNAEVEVKFSDPQGVDSHYYTYQITEYANQYGYYVNTSMDKCWGRMFISIDNNKKYRFVVSVHHFGYDNSTFAIGAFLSKVISKENDDEKTEYIDIPLKVPPFTVSSEREISEVESSIKQQIKLFFISALAYIVNEL